MDAAAGSGERAHQHDVLDQEGAGVCSPPGSTVRGAAREGAGAGPLQRFDVGEDVRDEQSEDQDESVAGADGAGGGVSHAGSGGRAGALRGRG